MNQPRYTARHGSLSTVIRGHLGSYGESGNSPKREKKSAAVEAGSRVFLRIPVATLQRRLVRRDGPSRGSARGAATAVEFGIAKFTRA